MQKKYYRLQFTIITKDDSKQPQKPKEDQISPQQLKNLLEAMNKEEKKVQEKVNKKKLKGTTKSNQKDW